MSNFKFSIQDDFNVVKTNYNEDKDTISYYCAVINCDILKEIVPISDIVQGFMGCEMGRDVYECAINVENFPFGDLGIELLGKKRYEEIVSGSDDDYYCWYPHLSKDEVVNLCQNAVDEWLKEKEECRFKSKVLSSRYKHSGCKKWTPSWTSKIPYGNQPYFIGGEYIKEKES
jgi:hypothetical protein